MVELLETIKGIIPLTDDIFHVLGWVTGLFGLSLPFLGRSNTYKIGKTIGKVLRAVLKQKNTSHLQRAKRYSVFIADFTTGLKDGVK